MGNGNGTFQAKIDYAVGSGPHSVAVGDFNGDGKTDLAVANYGSNTREHSAGQWQRHVPDQDRLRRRQHPYSVAVGDFNGDGKTDLAVANDGSNTVSILLGNGNGTFQAQDRLRRRRQPPGPSRWAISTATARPTWPWPTTAAIR